MGLMGWFVPQVLGVGYGYVGDILNGNMLFRLMIVLLILKILSVTISYGSGNAGGIFGPALFIGAMLGGIVGTLAHRLFPLHTATSGADALVGMGAVFAGVIRTPMTSVLMIFETTRDYAVIVPLMIANLVSFFIAGRLQRQSVYDILAMQDGIHLPSAEARREQSSRQVRRAMRPVKETLPAQLTVQQATDQIHSSEVQSWPVVDQRGVIGVVSKLMLNGYLAENQGERQLADLVDPVEFPHVHQDQSLEQALNRMGTAGLDMLPVVSRADVHKLEGVIAIRDVLDSYGVTKLGPI